MSASPFTDIASRDARLKRLFAAVRLNQRRHGGDAGARCRPVWPGCFAWCASSRAKCWCTPATAALPPAAPVGDHLIHALRQRGLDVARCG